MAAKSTKSPRKQAKRAAPRKRTTQTTKARVRKPEALASAGSPLAPPTSAARRMIFWDVENTSGESDLVRIIETLKIDRSSQPTEFVAVGNWRSIGAKIARLLAAAGARLVHSAPAVGVRDWSDLWIAVAAGQWLGHARAGDTLDMVSDDRAFDAVADAAAALGVVFRRISYRTLAATTERQTGTGLSRGQRRRAARRRAVASRAPVPSPAPAPVAAARTPSPAYDDEAHAASQEQVRAALARLAGGDTARWFSLDALANILRNEGFTRPPGSARLVTRIRRMKDVEVTASGMVRLLSQPASPASESADVGAAPETPAAKSRSRRTPRRRRRPRAAGTTTGAENVSAASSAAEPLAIGDPQD